MLQSCTRCKISVIFPDEIIQGNYESYSGISRQIKKQTIVNCRANLSTIANQ